VLFVANKVVWFDIPTRDLDRACAFYTAVLNANVARPFPGAPFAVIDHSGNDVAGCLINEPDNAPSERGPLLYMNAEGRLADAFAKALAHGGQMLQPIHSIAPHGFCAVLLDSEGNRIALHSMTHAE